MFFRLLPFLYFFMQQQIKKFTNRQKRTQQYIAKKLSACKKREFILKFFIDKNEMVNSIEEALIKMDLNAISYSKDNLYGTLLYLVEIIFKRRFSEHVDKNYNKINNMFNLFIANNFDEIVKNKNLKQMYGHHSYIKAKIHKSTLIGRNRKIPNQGKNLAAKDHLNHLILLELNKRNPSLIKQWKRDLVLKNLDNYTIV